MTAIAVVFFRVKLNHVFYSYLPLLSHELYSGLFAGNATLSTEACTGLVVVTITGASQTTGQV